MSGDLEITLLITLNPGADDRTPNRSQILDSAVDDVTGPLGFPFQMNGPVIVIEFRFCQWHCGRTRVDRTRDRFAVPVHFDHNIIPIGFAGPPVPQSPSHTPFNGWP